MQSTACGLAATGVKVANRDRPGDATPTRRRRPPIPDAHAGTRPLWPAAALTAVVALVGVVSFRTLADAPALGMQADLLDDGKQALTWVMPGGYAAEAGLRRGDVVQPAPVPLGSSAWSALRVVEGPRAGQVVALTRRWPVTADLVLVFVGLAFLAAGLIVYLRASDRPAANLFTVASGAFAITLVALPAIGDCEPWALLLEWVGSKVAMATFALFLLSTPALRWRPLRRLVVLAPIPILTFYAYTLAAGPELYPVVKGLGYSYIAVSTVIGVAAMLWPFIRREPPEHRRFWPVLLCSGAACAIYLCTVVLPYIAFRRYLLPMEIAIGGLALIPIGFVWAMVRYPLMGVALGPWPVLRTVFETMTDAVFVVGREGQLVHASRAGLALLGISGARQSRATFHELAAPLGTSGSDDASWSEPILSRVLAGEVVRDEEQELRLPGGKSVWMSVSGTPIVGERGQVNMAVLACRDVTERRVAEQQLLRQQRAVGILQERERLARELHDSLGQVLGFVSTQAQAVRALLARGDTAAADACLARLVAVAQEAHADVREYILGVTALVSPERGLLSSLEQYLQRFGQNYGLRAEIVAPESLTEARLDPAVEVQLLRIIQEALSNVRKHARAPDVRVVFAVEGDRLRVLVEDDGLGFDPERVGARDGQSFGLRVMRERAEEVGGSVEVLSAPGQGTRVTVLVPLARDGRDGTDEGSAG